MSYTFLYRVTGQEGRRTFHLDALPETCHGEPDVEEQILDTLREEDRMYSEPTTPITYTLDFIRPFSTARSIGTTTLRVVEIDRCYGGPEEGGWWYDAEHLLREFTVPTRSAARLRRRLERYADLANEGRRPYDDGHVRVMTGPWQPRPRPHYC